MGRGEGQIEAMLWPLGSNHAHAGANRPDCCALQLCATFIIPGLSATRIVKRKIWTQQLSSHRRIDDDPSISRELLLACYRQNRRSGWTAADASGNRAGCCARAVRNT